MKFWAKVKLKEQHAGILISAFFKEFNPESSIMLKGNDAELEIIFDDKPPLGIIGAISLCGGIEFEYKPISSTNAEEDEPEKDDQSEEATKNPKEVNSKKKENTSKGTKSNLKKDEITKLSEIAKESTNYKEFVEAVVNWLELESRQNFFMSVLKAATQLEKITWGNIEGSLNNTYTEWDKIFCTKKVAEKFEGHVSIMKLIKAIVKYQDFNFQEEAPIHQEHTEGKVIPEISYLEEMVGGVEKTQPIEKRVWDVLTKMGLNEKENDDTVRQLILRVANAAVKMENMDLPTILSEANISPELSMQVRMIFSEFVNDFVSKKGFTQKVKLIDFLKELQKVVMSETKI